MKKTLEEMRKEAIKRMKLLKVPQNALEIFQEGKIPVTCFNAELNSEMSSIQKKVMEKFMEQNSQQALLPFYICESWHGCDMISILYVDSDSETWRLERSEAKEGVHSIFAYAVQEGIGEFGDGFFSIEGGVLWRVS